ncbi:hypothetical protein OAB58_01930 [Gammaproteobacteria bacterium]|nr:hypothetical protein [Gammaproteobacteria bacterium]
MVANIFLDWAITRPNKVEFIAALPRNATSFKPKKPSLSWVFYLTI